MAGLAEARQLFEILAREHHDMLVAFLRTRCADASSVEDLYQETMLQAWRSLDRFDPSRPVGPWLRGIAANVVASHQRTHARRLRVLSEAIRQRISGQFEAIEQQPGETFEQRLGPLEACIERLPPPMRHALHCKYWRDLGVAAIAEAAETSVETAKKRLQRGRQKLLECLRDQRDGEAEAMP